MFLVSSEYIRPDCFLSVIGRCPDGSPANKAYKGVLEEVENAIRSGRYPSISELVREALELYKESVLPRLLIS